MVAALFEPFHVRVAGGGVRRVVRGASPRAHAGRVVRVGPDVRKNPHDHHITPRSLGACDAPRTTRRAALFRPSRMNGHSRAVTSRNRTMTGHNVGSDAVQRRGWSWKKRQICSVACGGHACACAPSQDTTSAAQPS
jgi:hypothetical protein